MTLGRSKKYEVGDCVFLKRWVDYSSKYGLGFLMSDHTVGVYFNDKTIIATEQDNTTYF